MRLDGVGRRYGLRGPWVVRGVDLDLPERTLVRIEGANGSGKSTLLRLCAGIDRPTTGRIRGRPRTAYVPERFPPALPFTALGYLTHLGRVHGLRGPAADRAAGVWLERFGAAGHAGTPLSELSKGTSQKVAVAQALLAAPELLVLDEAWTGLDAAARAELDRAVAERVADGGTVLFVDHDPRRLAGAADACHRVVDGRLCPAPPPDPAAHTPAAGPRVTVRAAPPGSGAELPEELPGRPVTEREPDGTARLTVPAAYSDALLRALLTARPPWHIHTVTAPVAQRPPDGPAGGDAMPGTGEPDDGAMARGAGPATADHSAPAGPASPAATGPAPAGPASPAVTDPALAEGDHW
ncbi:ATP-binding cassette domain-containing protein [Streptomyces sp. NBC_01525]|uniref:ABC transporter ATP-binding protein n=1 Tax=Streptomyces sp. NBC_01525 TaxID=2903893 RepID=UPI00386E1AAE